MTNATSIQPTWSKDGGALTAFGSYRYLYNSTIAAALAAQLGCAVYLDHYETEMDGAPIPVFAVPTDHMDDARALGLCVMELAQ